MTELEKISSLHDELLSTEKLLLTGLGELQEITLENDFYHLPQQLLASGLERLFKCYICLVDEAASGAFPDPSYLSYDLGHDLLKLLDEIVDNRFNTGEKPALEEDLNFLKNDQRLREILRILSEFGKYARYYNLDVVTGRESLPIDPTSEWLTLESSIEPMTNYLGEGMQEALQRDYFPRVNREIVAKIERCVRAIARQFTLGGHGGRLKQFSVTTTRFRNLFDDRLGETDYRRSIKVLQRDKTRWIRRAQSEVVASEWPTKIVTKEDFEGEWPFRANEVILERRELIALVVNIEGFDFALNGVAASHLQLPFPHDMGEAIIGKSIGSFIDMARYLGD